MHFRRLSCLFLLLCMFGFVETVQAKANGYVSGDPEYKDYTEMLNLIFPDWGGDEACRIEPRELKKKDGSNGVIVDQGKCKVPDDQEVCFTEDERFCYTGAQMDIRASSTSIGFRKNSATLGWELMIYGRCTDPNQPEWLLSFKYKFKQDDGRWQLTRRQGGNVLDLRFRCTRFLKESGMK